MARAKEMFERLRSLGFTKYGAAVLTGAMMQESRIDPNAQQGSLTNTASGNAVGIMQWDGTRKTKLFEKYGDDWNKVGNQLEYLMSEINGSEPAGKRLMNATSIDAAKRAEFSFIRWGHEGSRYSYANQITQQDWYKFKGHLPKTMEQSKMAKILNSSSSNYEAGALRDNTSGSMKPTNINVEYDVISSQANSKRRERIGYKLAPGVVKALDETLSSIHLSGY